MGRAHGRRRAAPRRLRRGRQLRAPAALPGGTIPDFTFLLPGELRAAHGRQVPDRQLPAAPRRVDRRRAGRAAATRFLRDVRQRVRELTGRGYVEPGATVDYVLLFIPNESVYGFIHEHDPTLIDEALRQRVVLCSPFTLFAVLAVVRQAVDSFARSAPPTRSSSA